MNIAAINIGSNGARLLIKSFDDNAPVIVPAAEIFMTVAGTLDCDSIIVPNISLADSIVDGIYKEQKNG